MAETIELNGKNYEFNRLLSFDEYIKHEEMRVSVKKAKEDEVDSISISHLKLMRDLLVATSKDGIADLTPGEVILLFSKLVERSTSLGKN